MVPALNELPEGAATVQFTLPVTPLGRAALNCTCVPMMALLGVTVIAGELKVAVTVEFAFMVMLHVTVVALVQPDHEPNVFAPAVVGAVTVTAVPALYVRVSVAVPLPCPLLSAGLTAMLTPDVGLLVFTVRVYVVAGGGLLLLDVPPPPPQAVNVNAAPAAIQNAALFRTFFIAFSVHLLSGFF